MPLLEVVFHREERHVCEVSVACLNGLVASMKQLEFMCCELIVPILYKVTQLRCMVEGVQTNKIILKSGDMCISYNLITSVLTFILHF